MWGPQPIGVRRLWSLIEGLPPEGAVGRSLRGDKNWVPGSTEYLLALLCEQVDQLTRVSVAAAGDKRRHKPLKVPRPGEEEAPRTIGFAEFLALKKEVESG